jgi:hypothetical protein
MLFSKISKKVIENKVILIEIRTNLRKIDIKFLSK